MLALSGQAGAQAPSQQPVPPSADPTPGLIGALQLPRDLSPWSMFASADIIVQSRDRGLGLRLGRDLDGVAGQEHRAVLRAAQFAHRARRHRRGTIAGRRAADRVGTGRGIVASFIAAAAHELRLSSDLTERDGIKERVASRLARLEAAAARDMNKGTGLLATIGSTAPFVGLFGTVWGIMNSFIGISKAQTTNLAVVAPGIAEALLATAIGLFAAIPAVIIYNQFARWIGGYKGLLGDAVRRGAATGVARPRRSGIAQRGRARAAE